MFAECPTEYHLLLRKTIFDHTGLMLLCLQNWDTLDDPNVSNDELQAMTEQLAFVNYRNLRKSPQSKKTTPTLTETQSIGYALRVALTCCHASFKVWVDIAQLEFGFMELKYITGKGFVSPSGFILELST